MKTLRMAIATVSLIAISACGSSTSSDTTIASTPAGADVPSFNDDDAMFAQMMIPHHEQAVTMSELALENTANPDVIALATAIRDAQGPEIEQMKSWLDGKSESHMHDMEMGGMLTEAELKELASLKDAAFDQMFLNAMIAHHEGALDMVSMIKDSTKAEVKKLYENIVTSQSAEIEAMKALLKE